MLDFFAFLFALKKKHFFHLMQVFSLLKVMRHPLNPFSFSAIHVYLILNPLQIAKVFHCFKCRLEFAEIFVSLLDKILRCANTQG